MRRTVVRRKRPACRATKHVTTTTNVQKPPKIQKYKNTLLIYPMKQQKRAALQSARVTAIPTTATRLSREFGWQRDALLTASFRSSRSQKIEFLCALPLLPARHWQMFSATREEAIRGVCVARGQRKTREGRGGAGRSFEPLRRLSALFGPLLKFLAAPTLSQGDTEGIVFSRQKDTSTFLIPARNHQQPNLPSPAKSSILGKKNETHDHG